MICRIECRIDYDHLARVLAARATRDRYREWNGKPQTREAV